LSYLPLTLGVGQTSGAKGEGFKPLSKTESEEVLRRDNHTCLFCGFRSTQFQRAVPFEGNGVTVCSFCEQVLELERAGLMGGGLLIWLPEISQTELNHIARSAYIAKSESGEMADAANRAIEALTARRIDAKKRLGTDDPLLLATVMRENLNDRERKSASSKLDGIRLLPFDKHMVRKNGKDINGFSQMVTFWKSANGPYANIPSKEWGAMFAKVSSSGV